MPVGTRRRTAPYTSLREWRSLASAGKTPSDVVLRKAYTCDEIKAVEGSPRQKQFVISTASIDREGDTVAPEGWQLDEYQRNPVVLWAHDGEQPPIGQTIRMGVDSQRRLVSVAQFAPPEDYAFADTIFRLITGGYIRAASVGFLPLEFEFDTSRRSAGFTPPCNFLKQSLLEWSVCPVPANPDCLLQARAAGIGLEPLLAWAERILDEGHGQPGVWMSQAEAAAVHKLLGTTTHSVGADLAQAAEALTQLTLGPVEVRGEELLDLIDQLAPSGSEPVTRAADSDASPSVEEPAALDSLEQLAAAFDTEDAPLPPDEPAVEPPVTRAMPMDPEDTAEDASGNDPEDVAENHTKKAMGAASAALAALQKARAAKKKAAGEMGMADHLHQANGLMQLAMAHTANAHGAVQCACGPGMYPSPMPPMQATAGAAAVSSDVRVQGAVERVVTVTPAPHAPAAADDPEDVLADVDPAELRDMIQAGVEASIATRLRLAAGRVD